MVHRTAGRVDRWSRSVSKHGDGVVDEPAVDLGVTATGFVSINVVSAGFRTQLGAEPRLTPESMPSGRCEECAMSGVCIGGHAKQARAETFVLFSR
jgi:hypothetical protein